jgi:predicted nucleic acid-binding protein
VALPALLFKSHPVATSYQAILVGRPLAVSLITLAEIEYGMEVKNWGGNRRHLMRRFLARFTPLLPDAETARLWARIKSACEKKGRPITFADAWIAAAAMQLNAPLVTHNSTDYEVVDNLAVLTVRTAS